MVTLPALVFPPFMYLSFVLTETNLQNCLMVTLPTRVLQLFMNCCILSSKITLCSYLIDSGTDFCAEQDDPLKLPYSHIGYKVSSTLHVLSKTTLLSRLLFTLLARVLPPFMNCVIVC